MTTDTEVLYSEDDDFDIISSSTPELDNQKKMFGLVFYTSV